MTATPPPPARSSMGRAKLILFLTIFIAMLGLSVLFPIIAPLGRQLGLSETQIGWFSTAYSLAQFVFAPIWGSRSERTGRKPVLLLGLVGFSLSFGLFGLFASLGAQGVLAGTVLFVLLVASRLLGGMLSSATLPTAQAMMADLSSEKDRAAAMGLIGAAFGLGVVFGPALGALLSGFGLTVPIFFSAGLGLLTALAAYFTLPETRRADARTAAPGDRRALLRHPGILLFLAVSALYTLASVGMEQTIAFYVQDTLHLTAAQTAKTVGGMLAIFGFLAAAVQGGAMRPLSKKIAPGPLIMVGLLVMGAGMFLLPLTSAYWTITGALAVVGIGSAILGPSLSAALSLSVGRNQQGAVAGLNSSALALGRMTGPLIGTGLYQSAGHGAPYLLSGGVLMALLVWTLIARPQVRAVEGAKV
ncbi:MFS transporter [Deinococcus metallilatus]|uniref:MFS family arabinose efflux permease n=1 Tax=Deinococcus metallilatus TaxID=1211322 RepID=A0AAJ5F565_9DEIO|nr:MFS transporter [Deinococcus metallilatus]MBB5296671.1 putative MFS family arabinose efflux permease [Deinococcus metallilatus]QBY09243.1 MFS transporter [Deinococcus metallilatus]RXJ09764.1 MFS transporter [Deinococcus metallilatus]TLK24229.1 MFS transporter [Deinococcus metallilatus]